MAWRTLCPWLQAAAAGQQGQTGDPQRAHLLRRSPPGRRGPATIPAATAPPLLRVPSVAARVATSHCTPASAQHRVLCRRPLPGLRTWALRGPTLASHLAGGRQRQRPRWRRLTAFQSSTSSDSARADQDSPGLRAEGTKGSPRGAESVLGTRASKDTSHLKGSCKHESVPGPCH